MPSLYWWRNEDKRREENKEVGLGNFVPIKYILQKLNFMDESSKKVLDCGTSDDNTYQLKLLTERHDPI